MVVRFNGDFCNTRNAEDRRPERVTNGCADDVSGTSEGPQLADPLCATRKSAEVGHFETKSEAASLPVY